MFQLIDVGQTKLNSSFQHAKQSIDDACAFLIQAVHEAQKGLYTELESIYGYKQLQLTLLEKEMQKVTKRMSQTIDFTQRLLKYSSPTEVIVFKPLLDSRLQGFLSFNADANQLLRSGTCEIRLGQGLDWSLFYMKSPLPSLEKCTYSITIRCPYKSRSVRSVLINYPFIVLINRNF
jgi:hypothetical protein